MPALEYDIEVFAPELHVRRDKNECLIGSGYSNQMNGEKNKFIKLKNIK